MAEVDADVGTEQIADNPEPLFGTIDYIILLLLLGFGAFWFLKRKTRQEEANSLKSYTIQYVYNIFLKLKINVFYFYGI